MLNFFGISKKDKITAEDTAKIFAVAINKVVNDGFTEIKSFLNHNNNLENSPNISDEDIKWFRLIIFIGNIHILSTNFEDNESLVLRNYIIDIITPYLEDDAEIAMDMFLNYETYFNDLLAKHVDPIEAMSFAVFDKYNINNCQSELLRRKNEPNPVLFNELKKCLSHFVWNWKDFLENCKVQF